MPNLSDNTVTHQSPRIPTLWQDQKKNDENGNLVLLAITKLVEQSNVTTEILNDQNLKFSRNMDMAISVLAMIFMAIGILGNGLSFLYFRRKVEVSLPLYLYAIVSAIDFCEASLSFPVIDSLLNARHPRLFDHAGFCLFWALMFSYLRRMSIIMVMAVCLTRAIATSNPFRNVRTSTVLFTIIAYTGLIFIVDVVYLSSNWLQTEYRPKESLCEVFSTLVNAKVAVYSILLQIELLIPCCAVIVSFFVCMVSLRGWRTGSRRAKTRRRATVTIALFSLVFLICNFPVFLLQLDYLLANFTNITTVDEFSHQAFLGWYAHLLSHFLLSLLNTAVNPCLYFLRMPNYRQWLVDIWTDPGVLITRRSRSMIISTSSSWYSTVGSNASSRRLRTNSWTNSSQQVNNKGSVSSHRDLNMSVIRKIESNNGIKCD